MKATNRCPHCGRLLRRVAPAERDKNLLCSSCRGPFKFEEEHPSGDQSFASIPFEEI